MQEKKSKRSDERKGSTRKNIRFEDDLLEQIEISADKDSKSFSEWVKDACSYKLNNKSS
jgi:hypothetical protein